ncbi:MAG: magnesium-translocating P-type ATPase [Candidatus Falkowbacteria bacterium]
MHEDNNTKNQSLDKIFTDLKSSASGLSSDEAKERLSVYGPNKTKKNEELSLFLKFLTYFKNPVIIILIFAVIISLMTGDNRNSIVIGVMILLSVALNFQQEYKSGKAAEKIAKKIALYAVIIRDGAESKCLAEKIVPGDIISLSAGDIIPADGQIIESDDFFINESNLTGESFPVEKRRDEQNIVYSGTNVLSGFAKVIITKTGSATEYGKIADKINEHSQSNAFELGINKFGTFLIKIIVLIVSAIFIINTWQHKGLLESLVFSVAVAVGVTPELLPMIMSVNMAKGSINMAKKGVIVKRLGAIPDFGSMDILCTDKTGTLTQDRITVIKYLNGAGNEDESVLEHAYINSHFETGIKSILDKAITGFKEFSVVDHKKVDEIPYDFLRKRSTIIYTYGLEKKMVLKGAPEEVFKICKFYSDNNATKKLDDKKLLALKKIYDDLSGQGFRVLAIASKDLTDTKETYKKEDEVDMILSGFIAFYDPPKLEAKATIEFMTKHGIEMKILTGDSPLVAKKICEDLDIKIKGIVTGDEFDLDTMNDKALSLIAINNNIFARFSPIQKERIIEILKKNGNVVGYMGDGINDAPSLKTADVGISVDNAVDVAKETADIILMKKGLKELMDGVLEGRKTFGNTMKYIMMNLSSNFGNMFSMIAASLYLPFFPMLPGQILVNNFLYDSSQLAIPSDQVDADYLRKPKHWDMKVIKKFMIVFGPISSLFDIITFYILYKVFSFSGSLFQTGWFIESLATQTLVIYIIRTKKIPFLQSSPSKYLAASALTVVIIGLIIGQTFIGSYLGFSPLPLKVLAIIAILVLIYLVMVEFTKRFFYNYMCTKYEI